MEDDNVLAQTLVNYNMLIDMIPELEDLVDTGIVTEEIARAIYNELSPVNQENFVESLDIIKRIVKSYDSRIKEMENDISAKTVVETPADYIPLQKEKKDLQSRNEFLERQIKKRDKDIAELRKQISELQKQTDPKSEYLAEIHAAVQTCSERSAAYLKEMDKYTWLLEEMENIPEADLEEYNKTIKSVKLWCLALDHKIDEKLDKAG